MSATSFANTIMREFVFLLRRVQGNSLTQLRRDLVIHDDEDAS